MVVDRNSTSSAKVLPTHAQVVIIGGGVIGCRVAYYLTKFGWTDVVLLELKQLSSGTTWVVVISLWLGYLVFGLVMVLIYNIFSW
jgi:glycine/D-amino acid oxidase-like deaminating enzyme